jgi:hypothetical protein
MKSGAILQHLVAFDEHMEIDDGHGNYEGRWVEQCQRRAGYVYLRGGEAVIASRLEAQQPIIVTVRADSETRLIDPSWRMRDLRNGAWEGDPEDDGYWTGPEYAIKAVTPSENRRWIDVLVISGEAP